MEIKSTPDSPNDPLHQQNFEGRFLEVISGKIDQILDQVMNGFANEIGQLEYIDINGGSVLVSPQNLIAHLIADELLEIANGQLQNDPTYTAKTPPEQNCTCAETVSTDNIPPEMIQKYIKAITPQSPFTENPTDKETMDRIKGLIRSLREFQSSDKNSAPPLQTSQ